VVISSRIVPWMSPGFSKGHNVGMVFNLLSWLTSKEVMDFILQLCLLVTTAIGAAATAYIAWLARPNLKALFRYVDDTRRLAETSVEQLERSQTPFVVLVPQKGETPDTIRYRIENQGSGPAVNVASVLEWEGGGRQHFLPKTLGTGGFYEFAEHHRCLKAEFSYQSLSGRQYATKINRQ
jgi:hypothetical protein